MFSLDSETLGLDVHHGAKPFFVTVCHDNGEQQFWEWDVNPVTRQPIIPKEDVKQISNLLEVARKWGESTGFQKTAEEHVVVGQNCKFDAAALHSIGVSNWPWKQTRDTLIAGHLLASNQPHDLTSMAVHYLGCDIEPLEKKLKEACNQARRIIQQAKLKVKRSEENGTDCDDEDRFLATWRIAKQGLPEMPSAKSESKEKGADGLSKSSPWAFDMWLARALIDHWWETSESRGYWSEKDSSHGAKNKSGWEFRPPEIENGDHPWWTVLADYSNADSAITLALWKVMEKELKKRNLWAIYKERLEVLPVVAKMERHGVTVNGKNLHKLEDDFVTESERLGRVCVNIAADRGFDLELPKSGSNDLLDQFCFGLFKEGEDGTKLKGAFNRTKSTTCLNLEPLELTENGNPSLSKQTIEVYQLELPSGSKELAFIKALKGKRKRDTAVSFLQGYRRYWLPLSSGSGHILRTSKDCPCSGDTGTCPICDGGLSVCSVCGEYESGLDNECRINGWFVLHPSLNVTGTDTLRCTCANPNGQQISRDEDFTTRSAFGPAPGREWWSFDYENIELRIPAYEAGEHAMIDLFERPNDPPYFGSNHLLCCHILHHDKFEACKNDKGEVDGRVFKSRYKATWYSWTKNGNFAVQYGAIESSGTADRAYHMEGAQSLIQKRLGKISDLNRRMIAQAEKFGWVETIPDRTVDKDRGYPLLCTRTENGRILPTVPLSYHIQGCLAGSSRVWTSDGLRRIDELVDQEVIVWTGFTWANAVGLNRGECQRAKIHLSSGLTINCDVRHKLKNEQNDWVDFKELKVGGLVALPKNDLPLKKSTEMTWEFLFGFIIGDGWLGNRDGRRVLQITVGEKKKQILEEIVRFLENNGFKEGIRGGIHWKVIPATENKSQKYSMSVENARLSNYLESAGFEFGCNSFTKRVPKHVWESQPQGMRDFLEGLWLSDGSRLRDMSRLEPGCEDGSGCTLNMKNQELLSEVQILAATVEYGTDHKALSSARSGKDVSQYVAERVIERNSDFQEIYRYDTITKIEVLDQVEETFTMSVDDELHQFVADGVIHKNTAMWCTMKAMVRVQERFDRWEKEDGFDAKIMLQVHDELVIDFPAKRDQSDKPNPDNVRRIKEVQSLMSKSGEDIGVPLTVGVSWHPNDWSHGEDF